MNGVCLGTISSHEESGISIGALYAKTPAHRLKKANMNSENRLEGMIMAKKIEGTQ